MNQKAMYLLAFAGIALVIAAVVYFAFAKRQPSAPKDTAGGQTSVEGVAQDAKMGAVVVDAQNQPIYIQGLESWPQEFSGKQVVVTGMLVQKKYLPTATVDAGGAISQGTTGGQLETVLTNAKWELK